MGKRRMGGVAMAALAVTLTTALGWPSVGGMPRAHAGVSPDIIKMTIFVARADGRVLEDGFRLIPPPAPRLAAPIVGIAMHDSAFMEQLTFQGLTLDRAFWLA